MGDYRPPLDDIRLVLDEISDISAICDLPAFEHVDVETIDGVLDELGRFVVDCTAERRYVIARDLDDTIDLLHRRADAIGRFEVPPHHDMGL